MSQTTSGRIKIVARTGGIILEGMDNYWFNPPKEQKETVKQNFHPGDAVEIEHNEQEVLTIKKIDEEEIPEQDMTTREEKPQLTPKGQAMLDEAKNGPTKDRSIVRQACLKAACTLPWGDKVNSEHILAYAAAFEEWVYR